MMVNPDVKPENTPKNAKRQQPIEKQRILKPKYKLSGCSVFTVSLPGGRFDHLSQRQLRHCELKEEYAENAVRNTLKT